MGDAEQNTSGRDSSGRQNNSISTVVKDFDYDLTMLNGVCAPKVGGCRKNYVCYFICSVDVEEDVDVDVDVDRCRLRSYANRLRRCLD
jgi:hypothetical protein